MEDLSFPNIQHVVDYLTQNGWKIKKSACYQHASQGKIRPQPDGTYMVKAVLKYAKLFLKRCDGQAPSARMESAQQERLDSEARKLRYQADILKRRSEIMSGAYVKKDEFERALAQRAMLFTSDIEVFCQGAAAQIISLVGGDPLKVSDLIQHLREQSSNWLDRYAIDGGVKPMAAFPETLDDAAGAIDEDDDDENEGQLNE